LKDTIFERNGVTTHVLWYLWIIYNQRVNTA